MSTRRKLSENKINQQICEEYAEIHGVTALDLDDIAEWAIRTGRYHPVPVSMKARCKRALARGLRAAHFTDPQNRDVRKWHAYAVEQADGQLRWEWIDLPTAEPGQMRLSLGYGRRQILGHCRQHQRIVDSYNDNNLFGADLQAYDYNFNLDLEEEQFPVDYPEEPGES